MASEPKDTVLFKIQPIVPEGMPLIYANQAAVLHTLNEFVLSFFQATLPLSAPVETDVIRAYCVAQIVLTPEHMEQFVEMANKNLETYRATKKAQTP